MRKLFLFMLVSVDGYFEGKDHDISWHNVNSEFNDFVQEQDAGIGALLFGRRTYDLMAGYWPTPKAVSGDPKTANFMNETPKIVASRTAFTSEWQNATAISENVAGAVRTMKEQEGKDIAIFGSNELCVSLMADDLVDEFRLMVCPVAIGAGTPLFAGLATRKKFTLSRIREFKSGNVLQVYLR